MVRKVFFSFHYKPDNWRASQVRNIGQVEGNSPASDNDWETVTKGGDAAIKKWIDEQMYGRSCVVVLVGAKTAGRKWIKYEIRKAWEAGKGLVGIYVNKLKDVDRNTAAKGRQSVQRLYICWGTDDSAGEVSYPVRYNKYCRVQGYLRQH